MLKNLITFGDSWVWGVGAGYQKGQSKENFKKISDNTKYTKNSFRSLICNQFGLKNRNFSAPGSSNQQQFRFASEFFLGSKLHNLTKKHDHNFTQENIVLWGLTSVYRHEVWNKHTAVYDNIFMTSNEKYAKNYVMHHFDENLETDRLFYHIELFNAFFKLTNVRHYWFNIFDEHVFPRKFTNMLFNGVSLLSLLTEDYAQNDQYHMSNWNDTDRKITKAIQMQLVNPHSLHPTQTGHKKILDLFNTQINFTTGEKLVDM